MADPCPWLSEEQLDPSLDGLTALSVGQGGYLVASAILVDLMVPEDEAVLVARPCHAGQVFERDVLRPEVWVVPPLVHPWVRGLKGQHGLE